MEPIKAIRFSEKYISKQLILSGVVILVGIAGMFLNAGHLLGLGIFLFVINFAQKKRDAIKVYDEHIEVKLGPIAPTKFIKLDQFTEVVKIGERKLTFCYSEAGKDRKLKLHNSVFTEEDLEYLNELVSKQINKAA